MVRREPLGFWVTAVLACQVHHNLAAVSQPRILIADDDPAMRSLLVMLLQAQGYLIEPCEDGAALVERIEASLSGGGDLPQLVISDVRMPGLSGIEMLHWVQRECPEVPVILITAFGDRQTHQRAAELGALAVVNKPFDLGELRSQVARALAD